MKPKAITMAALDDDANGVCVDQTTGEAANLLINGALATGGVATIAEAQIMSIEGSGDNSGITFTITGTDSDGKSHSEVVTGSNAGTAVSTTYFKTITQIAASDAVTGNVEIGPLKANGAVTKTYCLNYLKPDFGVGLYVTLEGSAAMTYTVDHSEDYPFDSYTNGYQSDATWRATSGLSSLTASDESNIAFPCHAVRLRQSASTSGTMTFTIIQG